MKKLYWYCLAVVVLMVAAVGYWRYTVHLGRAFRITFLDVGQGDSALIQFRSGQRLLVDCGPDRSVLAELGRVLPWHVRTIDFLLVTHPDADHYAGCIDVLKRYQVNVVFTNGDTKDDALYETFARAVKNEPSSAATIQKAPDTFEIAGTTLEFLAPDPELPLKLEPDDSNDSSIVFRLLDPETALSVLFTGDAEAPLERALLEQYCKKKLPTIVSSAKSAYQAPCPPLHAKILKTGHHGSDTSSGEEFLAAVGAQTGIVSVGAKNRFGHPSRRVLKRLERSGMQILRTDKQGAIVIK